MSQRYVPEGFHQVTPYLTVEGANRLLDFLVEVFDAEVMNRFDKPDGTIGNAAVRIGDSTIEVAEATDRFGPMPGAIHIYVPDVEQAHQKAIQHGAQVIHEPMDMDYGERASAVKDPAGNHWYIATYVGGRGP